MYYCILTWFLHFEDRQTFLSFGVLCFLCNMNVCTQTSSPPTILGVLEVCYIQAGWHKYLICKCMKIYSPSWQCVHGQFAVWYGPENLWDSPAYSFSYISTPHFFCEAELCEEKWVSLACETTAILIRRHAQSLKFFEAVPPRPRLDVEWFIIVINYSFLATMGFIFLTLEKVSKQQVNPADIFIQCCTLYFRHS